MPTNPTELTTEEPRGGLTSPVLSGRQASVWSFIDQVLVKYGPLGLMLVVVCYYVLTKDSVIAEKDKLLMEQQKTMVAMTKDSTEALVKTSGAQIDLARSVDENTKTMARLVNLLERQPTR